MSIILPIFDLKIPIFHLKRPNFPRFFFAAFSSWGIPRHLIPHSSFLSEEMQSIIVIKLDVFIIFLYYKGEHISILYRSANSCSCIQYLPICTCLAEYLNPWNFTRFPPKTANIGLTGQIITISAVDYTFVQKDFGLFRENFLK